MAKLFILFLFFLSVNTVSAARLVPGSLPSTTPLLPLPAGVQPNLKGNVNSSLEPVSPPPEAPVPNDSSGTDSVSVPDDSSDRQVAAKSGSRVWFVVLGLIAVLLVYGILRLRHKE